MLHGVHGDVRVGGRGRAHQHRVNVGIFHDHLIVRAILGNAVGFRQLLGGGLVHIRHANDFRLGDMVGDGLRVDVANAARAHNADANLAHGMNFLLA